MNTRDKGIRTERKAREVLQSYGYMVEKKNWNRWESPDFWGMFDLVAVLGTTVRWIQVKSHKTDYHKAIRDVRAFVLENKNFKCPAEVWLYEGKGQWRVKTIGISKEEELRIVK